MMKSSRKTRLKRSRAAREAKAQNSGIVTSDEETNNKRSRFRRKRRRKENDAEEEIIDGFLIKSFKNLPVLLQASHIKEVTKDKSEAKINGKDESTETSSANAREESYASSVDSTCGGYLGESEKSEGEESKKPDEEDFFRALKSNISLPKVEITKESKVSPLQSNNNVPSSLKPKKLNVQPTASVVAVPRKSNVVTPMVTMVKPSTLHQQQQPYPSLSPVRTQRLSSQRFTLPTPNLIPSVSPHPNFIDQQSFLHAELNSRFLASTRTPIRHPNFHPPHPGVIPNYENPRQYGGFLNYGAFQPKLAPGIPQRVMMQDYHKEQSALSYRKPTKPGRWCSLHVSIARLIQRFQKKKQENKGAFLKPERLSSFHAPTNFPDRVPRHHVTAGHSASFGGLADLGRGWKGLSSMYGPREQPGSSRTKPDFNRQDRAQIMTELTRPPPHLQPTTNHRYDYYPPPQEVMPPMLTYPMPPPPHGQYYMPQMVGYYPYGPPLPPHYLRPPH
nr:autism susceptibility gene 2 protein homolog [Ciona intestinalis]|eukprot:XP_018671558.1 autism susceptibility gene 2 protein homolog [Ciona intestinalis]